jgi:putative membrane protein
MDILNNILFWLHLTALSAGGAAAFGMPVVGSMLATATPELRPTLFSIAHGLSSVSRAALGVLIVTGPLLIWLKYGGAAGFSTWFWVKMVLVVLLLVDVIYIGVQMKRAETGDRAAAGMLPRLGAAATVLLILVVLSAVFTFG